jgi:hypothetical protein
MTRSLCSEIFEQTVSWVLQHEAEFRLPCVAAGRLALQSIKPLGELTLVCDVIDAYAIDQRDREVASSLRSFCWGQFQNGHLLADMIWGRPDLIVAATIYTSLKSGGYRCQDLETAIEAAIQIAGVRALEFPPWRLLEIDKTLRRLALPSPWSTQDIAANTWLFKRPEPWSICDNAAYSLTHTVFYLSDFGRETDALPPEVRDYLEVWTPTWIQHYSSVGNYDLLAEMIMVAACLHTPCDCQWFESLLGGCNADGSVTGPEGAGAALLDWRETPTPSRLSFIQHYHTTLVSAMAAGMYRSLTNDRG